MSVPTPPPVYPPSFPPSGSYYYQKPPSDFMRAWKGVVTLADKVRLGFAAGCQLIGFILLLFIPTTDGSSITYTDTNGMAIEAWAALLLVASTVLITISVRRFIRPLVLLTPPAHDGGPLADPPVASVHGPVQDLGGLRL